MNGSDSPQSVVNENETENTKSKAEDSDEYSNTPYWLLEESKICRVCLEDEQLEVLISPCNCKGTLQFVHASCLEHWLLESMSSRCELCQSPLHTKQALQCTLREAVFKWFFTKQRCRGTIYGNSIINLIAPLLVLFCIYFCVMIADYYYGDNLDSLPVGAITILLLFIMVCIMGLGFASWMYFKIQLQYILWFRWWQSKLTIKILLQKSESCKPKEVHPEGHESYQQTEAPAQVQTNDSNNTLP